MNLILKKLLGVLILSLPFSLFAQNRLPDNMFIKTLPNGLQIFVIEDNSVPLATIVITCKNGSYTETAEFNGLSHLYEHMFFKSNRKYKNPDDFMSRIGELGMQYNGSTTKEYVDYYFTLPDFNLHDGLEFMNSAIRYPRFERSEMQRENVVVDGEFQRHESSPGFALADAMDHHMWGNLYSRKNVIGNHDVIRNATPELMDSIKNKYYFPNNSLLTVAGNVNHDKVFADVEKIYGSWKASGFDPFVKWPIPEFAPLQKSDYFIVQSKLSKVPVILLEWQGPDTRGDINSTYAADVFSYIINQNSSKLSKALVQTGLALQVSIGYTTYSHVGPININIVPNQNKIKECMEELHKQIALMDNDDYITDEQIETAKSKLAVRQEREGEEVTTLVQEITFWWSSASIDYFTTYEENLQKVNRVDMQNYVRKYIKNKFHCAGLLISPELASQIKPENFFNPNN